MTVVPAWPAPWAGGPGADGPAGAPWADSRAEGGRDRSGSAIESADSPTQTTTTGSGLAAWKDLRVICGDRLFLIITCGRTPLSGPYYDLASGWLPSKVLDVAGLGDSR